MSAHAEAPRPRHAGAQIITPRRLAMLGMALAPVALWLTLPPLTLDTIAAPLILGAISALLGYVRRHDYSIFVWYRLITAGIVLLLIATGVRAAGF